MKFFSVTKPGIIFGNMMTLCGGYFLAASPYIDLFYLLSLLISMALIIACGCVLNNVIDSDIDLLMERTKDRVLVTGLLSPGVAIVYAILLGLVGFSVLILQTNSLTVWIAVLGLFFYVVLYSLWFKRYSIYGTLVGGVSGAVPPVVGYCAVTAHLDAAAFILFFILFFWQMPHFYAIAMYRHRDYAAAAIPVLPLRKNTAYTQRVMLVYIFLFAIAAVLPSVLGYAGILYGLVALCLGVAWFVMGCKGLSDPNHTAWARRMFLFSIIAITILCLMMAVKQ